MGRVIPPKLEEKDIAWARVLYERVGSTNEEIAEQLREKGLSSVTEQTVAGWAKRHGWVRGFQAAIKNRTEAELARAMHERDGVAVKRARELGQELGAYEKQVLEDLREVYPEKDQEFEIARQKLMSAGQWTDSQIEAWVRSAAMNRAGKLLAHRAEWGQLDELRGQAVAITFKYIEELRSGQQEQKVLKAMESMAKSTTALVGQHIKMLADKQKAEAETYGLHTDDPTGDKTFEERLKLIGQRDKE